MFKDHQRTNRRTRLSVSQGFIKMHNVVYFSTDAEFSRWRKPGLTVCSKQSGRTDRGETQSLSYGLFTPLATVPFSSFFFFFCQRWDPDTFKNFFLFCYSFRVKRWPFCASRIPGEDVNPPLWTPDKEIRTEWKEAGTASPRIWDSRAERAIVKPLHILPSQSTRQAKQRIPVSNKTCLV